MEFEGRVRKILPLRNGTSKSTGNEWKALPFIFEYFENETDRYADSVLLETFDTNVIDNLQEGMEVRCGFSHRTREYEGRTYNEVRLYKIQSIKKSQEPATPQAPATYDNTPPPPQQAEKKNDLPF
jgi:hypothetical protein